MLRLASPERESRDADDGECNPGEAREDVDGAKRETSRQASAKTSATVT